MRYILILLMLFHGATTMAQYKSLNLNKVIIRWDTTQVDEIPETVNQTRWTVLRLKSNGDTLAVIYETTGNVWTKADIVAGSIAQIGTTTLIRITLPNATGSSRYFLNQQVLYHYTETSHTMTNLFNDNPLKEFRRSSDGKITALFNGSGCKWNIDPSTVVLVSQGIVRVVIP